MLFFKICHRTDNQPCRKHARITACHDRISLLELHMTRQFFQIGKTDITRLVYFVVLVLIQALILNNIHFLRIATPFLYLYFIIKMPVGTSRDLVVLFSFLIGLVIDMFSNTPGMHAAACTLAGFIREPLQYNEINQSP